MAIDDLVIAADLAQPASSGGSAAEPDHESALSLAECQARIDAALSAVVDLRQVQCLATGPALAQLTAKVLALHQLAEAATVSLVAEAIDRGLVAQSTAAGAAQWVARLAVGEPVADLLPPERAAAAGPLVPPDQRDSDDAADVSAYQVPGLEPAHAARIAKVAAACLEPVNSLLADAVTSGQVATPTARTALEELPKVMAVLPAATRDEVLDHFLSLPPGAGSKSIRELTRRVIATYADQSHLKDEDLRHDAAESLTWAPLPTGLTRFSADLAPTHAAQLIHAIGALSAPAPGNTCCADPAHRHVGEPDTRTPAKRRADALTQLIDAAAGIIDHDGATTSHGSARIVVTIDNNTLAGQLRGYGRTELGTALSPEHIRQLACDADLIPMVLGTQSQPLDVGRTHRLITGPLRAAVTQRDRHCTYPGCSRPPPFCHVHHITHWAHGGPTSLTNSALLCARHHTIVHRDRSTATASDTEVTWHLAQPAAPT